MKKLLKFFKKSSDIYFLLVIVITTVVIAYSIISFSQLNFWLTTLTTASYPIFYPEKPPPEEVATPKEESLVSEPSPPQVAEGGKKICASTVHYEPSYSLFANCDSPGYWCARIDYGPDRWDYEGEMTFNLSTISSSTKITSAKICSYLWYGTKPVINYIEKIPSSTCDKAPSIARPPVNIGSALISDTIGWHCIDVDSSQVQVGEKFAIRWWGNDLNGATSPYTCYYAQTTLLVNCGGSHPAGCSYCNPYLEISYTEE